MLFQGKAERLPCVVDSRQTEVNSQTRFDCNKDPRSDRDGPLCIPVVRGLPGLAIVGVLVPIACHNG